MAWVRLALVVAAVASAGCLSQIVPGPPPSTLAFACAAIDPATAPRMRVVTYVEAIGVDVDAPMQALAEQLRLVSGRASQDVTPLRRAAPEAPEGGWTDAELEAWVRDEPFLGRDQVTLRVLWLPTLEDGNVTGWVPAPGAVVLSASAIESGAARLHRPEAEVATAVLLHHVGHALGATNRGIPVQDPDLQEREGAPGHDADPGSVLAVGWETVPTMAWAANATYDHYPAAALADWQAARESEGVCGVRR